MNSYVFFGRFKVNKMNQNSNLSHDPAFLQLCKDIKKLGFDGVVYTFYPKTFHKSVEMSPILQVSEKFAPYVERYNEMGYANRDFVIRLAFQGKKKTIDWWEEINAGNVRDDELEVTLDGRDNYGIQNGITIPIVKGPDAIAGISVITFKRGRKRFEKLKEEKTDELLDLTRDYHFSIMSSNEALFQFIESIVEHFDEPKKNVLRHVLRNQPMKNIVKWNPEISCKNAERILGKIKKELGGVSSFQLLYLLGKMNAERLL